MNEDNRRRDGLGIGEGDEEEVKGVAEEDSELGGGELFGPAQPGARYRCGEHGPILARKVDWLPDGRPHCPTCGELLTKE